MFRTQSPEAKLRHCRNCYAVVPPKLRHQPNSCARPGVAPEKLRRWRNLDPKLRHWRSLGPRITPIWTNLAQFGAQITPISSGPLCQRGVRHARVNQRSPHYATLLRKGTPPSATRKGFQNDPRTPLPKVDAQNSGLPDGAFPAFSLNISLWIRPVGFPTV
jgi:hypothetical protein